MVIQNKKKIFFLKLTFLNKIKTMTSKFHSTLLKDILSMLTDSNDYNVIIQIKENQNIKEFRAHSNILRVGSPYFKNILSVDKIKNENNVIIINKPNITPTVFEIVLK